MFVVYPNASIGIHDTVEWNVRRTLIVGLAKNSSDTLRRHTAPSGSTGKDAIGGHPARRDSKRKLDNLIAEKAHERNYKPIYVLETRLIDSLPRL